MDRNLQKEEAIRRLKMLKIHPNALKEFEDSDTLNLSEGVGILYWLTNEQKKYVEKFEKTYGAVVYHVIHSNTEFGELLSFLFVGKDEDEWEMDRDDINEGYAFAYVENVTCPDCSEFGTIGIKPQVGGIVRTA